MDTLNLFVPFVKLARLFCSYQILVTKLNKLSGYCWNCFYWNSIEYDQITDNHKNKLFTNDFMILYFTLSDWICTSMWWECKSVAFFPREFQFLLNNIVRYKPFAFNLNISNYTMCRRLEARDYFGSTFGRLACVQV